MQQLLLDAVFTPKRFHMPTTTSALSVCLIAWLPAFALAVDIIVAIQVACCLLAGDGRAGMSDADNVIVWHSQCPPSLPNLLPVIC